MYGFGIKDNYYDDVGILYSFDCDWGKGYVIKRWNTDFDPQTDKPNFGDGMPSARRHYLDKDFKKNLEFLQNKRAATEKARNEGNYADWPRMNIQLVTDESILAKFALMENDLSRKTLIFVQLEKLKDRINAGECDLEKTLSVLQSL